MPGRVCTGAYACGCVVMSVPTHAHVHVLSVCASVTGPA